MLANVRKLIGKETAADIEAAIRELGRDLDDARARQASAEQRRGEAALAGDAAKHRLELQSARDDVADFEAASVILEKKFLAARDAEKEAERRKHYNAARKAVEAASRVLRERYPGAIRELRSLLQQIESARALANLANDDLPAGAGYIGDPEHSVRGISSRTEKVISEKRVWRWIMAGGDPRFPLAPELEKELTTYKENRAKRLYRQNDPTTGGTTLVTHEYDRVELIERVIQRGVIGDTGPALRQMDLPGLTVRDGRYGAHSLRESPGSVLAALELAELSQKIVSEPEQVTEYRLVVPETAQAPQSLYPPTEGGLVAYSMIASSV